MANSSDKHAFLITCNKITRQTIKLYHRLKQSTNNTGDVFLLYHNTGNKIPAGLNDVRIETFTDDILQSLGYKPLKKTLLPGSNHFAVLNFFLNHPGYAHYWCIENDVAFNGNWNDFFNRVSPDPEYDFISSHIRKYADMPDWFWWDTFHFPDGAFSKDDLLSSFNPIYRISNRALTFTDGCLKSSYSGHHEVVLPSLLKKSGFSLADLGTEDNHITPRLSLCTLTTMRWKPVFFAVGNKKNKLYHPVKTNITFRQLLVYVKRTILGTKRYLTD